MRNTLLFLMALICQTVSAQEKLNYEIDLSLDNDAFYLIAAEDQYYSSGIFATFRKSVNTESGLYSSLNKNDNVSNLLQGFHFSHLMYTTSDIRISNVNLFDRPYAGGFSLGYSLNLFLKNDWVFNIQQDLGIMGPAAGTGKLQDWWHNFFGMIKPRGWDYEINNTPHINTRIEILKSLPIAKSVDIVYESKYEFGTIFNNVRQGAIIRIGNLKGLGKSGYKNGLIGIENLPERINKTIEWYIFLGVATEFVVYNTTIEGNIIGKESVHTEVAENVLFMRKSGLNLHWQKFDFGIHFYFNTAETSKSQNHRYIRIRLTKRF